MRISDWSSDVCSSDLYVGSRACDQSTRVGGILRLVDVDVEDLERRPKQHPQRRIVIYEQNPHQASGSWTPESIPTAAADRKSVVSGKSVAVRLYLGGRRILTKKSI